MNLVNHRIDLPSKTLTLTVPGDILSTNADQLRQEIQRLLESEAVHLAAWDVLKLDLKGAAMIDSVGLNLLVSLIKTARARNARTVAVISSSNIQRSLVFTRLDTQMEVQLAA
ncbi:MAG TPA: STAS domain-containing protein [Methylomirabilota bacterium]|nr:STAS domain-containing protein [Methylomirabilota bacterium]